MSTTSGSGLNPELLGLRDGRRLAYLDLGDPDGYPLISCHGGLSSRLDVLPAGASAQAHGLRLICPDRPGIGRSDREPHRSLLDWPTDVGELMGHLEIERWAVMGWSLGGMYAQACASVLGDQVSVAVLVASVIPADWPEMRAELNSTDRFLMNLSRRAPHVARGIFHLMGTAARRTPTAYARHLELTGDSATAVPAAVAEGMVDTSGVIDDYRVFEAPWGFSPQELEVPVQIWQGDSDDLVPASWAIRLRDAIPEATLNAVPGGTHFLWYHHWDDIFEAVLDAVV